MKPVTFTIEIPKGDSFSARSYSDGKQCVSKWKATWSERLRILVTGDVWLWVESGSTQPPLAIGVEAPILISKAEKQ